KRRPKIYRCEIHRHDREGRNGQEPPDPSKIRVSSKSPCEKTEATNGVRRLGTRPTRAHGSASSSSPVASHRFIIIQVTNALIKSGRMLNTRTNVGYRLDLTKANAARGGRIPVCRERMAKTCTRSGLQRHTTPRISIAIA